jgi:hypothetical protein
MAGGGGNPKGKTETWKKDVRVAQKAGTPVTLDLQAVTDAAGVVQALARITEAAASGEITT